ncbi:hypothetical protein EV426DRAFT_622907 [Tirmania nivea]|nr:hypothetical protein EV426DRAFT_622907 [Tirmania nivea]
MATASDPPPPNTNRRVFHDLCVAASIPPDDKKLKTFRIALIAAETWKRKDLMSGGAVIGPEGIEVFARGKKPLELDEIDGKVVKKAMKQWIEENLDDEQKKAVEEAGILKPTRASGKKSVLVVGKSKDEGGAAGSRGKSSAIAEPDMKKQGERSSDYAENHEQQQLQREEEPIEIDWDKDVTYTWNCDEIRRKIRTLLENSGMEITAFQRAINAPSGTLGRFMKLRGAKSGENYKAFEGATRYFHAREAAGLPMPSPIEKPVPKTADTGSAEVVESQTAAELAALELEDSDITDSDTDTIPVFDSCDEIRRKISAHLRLPYVTQAQFLRDIAAQFTGQDVKIQSKQLSDFRSKSGALAGNTSRVYYGAYVYFEKLRLIEEKPKSKHRLEMEKRWAPDGVDIDRVSGRERYIVRAGRELAMDEYGQVSVY